jgi:hypothetical protein
LHAIQQGSNVEVGDAIDGDRLLLRSDAHVASDGVWGWVAKRQRSAIASHGRPAVVNRLRFTTPPMNPGKVALEL